MQLFKVPPPPQDLVVTTEPNALAQRQTLIDLADTIKSITTASDNELATQWGSAAQKLIKEIEAAGLDLRRPYNAAADAIMAKQKEYLDPLKPHLKRIGALAAVYRTEQERKAEAERRARADELARLQETQRQAAEDMRKAAEAGDLASAVSADLLNNAASVAMVAAAAAPEPTAAKTVGQSFQDRVLGWECTDIDALYAARPDLCTKPEPKASAIKAVCCPERPVPGLRLWWESKVSFKSR